VVPGGWDVHGCVWLWLDRTLHPLSDRYIGVIATERESESTYRPGSLHESFGHDYLAPFPC